MYLNHFEKRMALITLILLYLLLMGCNIDTMPKHNNETDKVETNLEKNVTERVITINPTSQLTPQPTIEVKASVPTPTPTPTPTNEPVSELTISDPTLIVRKAERILELWDGESFIDSFDIDIGKMPEGDKKIQGDCKTPEGEYYIGYQNPNSHYYLSLGISYPNKEDAKEALNNGQIDQTIYDRIAEAIDNGRQPPANTVLGGGITVHGRVDDSEWTRGCVAVDNEVMDLLWEVCPVGTNITIYE